MDDRKFDEIMREYVDSASGFQRDDFKKLSHNLRAEKKRKLPRLAWAGITLSFIIVIGLSVTLPFILKPKVGQYEIYALTNDDIVIQNIAEPDDFLKNNCSGLVFPSISYVNIIINSIKLKKDDQIIGLKANLDIYGEECFSLSFYTLEKKYRLKSLNIFNELEYTVNWEGTEVNYSYNMLSDITETYMFFEKSSYVYYMKAVTYRTIPPADLLNIIF